MKKIISLMIFGIILINIVQALTINQFDTGVISTNITTEENFSHLSLSSNYPYNNLLIYYPFDVNETNTINKSYDYSGYNQDTTLKNGVLFTQNCLYGSCYTFDGINDYMRTQNTNFNPYSANSYSVSFWFKKGGSDSADFAKWIGGNYISGSNSTFSVGSRLNQYIISFDARNGSCTGTGTGLQWNYTTTSGQWNHLVIVHNGTTAFLYGNGVLKQSQNVQGAGNKCSGGNNGDIQIMGLMSGVYLNGMMDELMIFNTTLNSTDVTSIFTNQTARHLTSGTQEFTNLNISTNGKDNYASLSMNCQNNIGTTLTASIGTNTGSGYTYGGENTINSCSISSLQFTGNPNNISLKIKYNPSTSYFYSPIVQKNITINSWFTYMSQRCSHIGLGYYNTNLMKLGTENCNETIKSLGYRK